MIIDQIRGVLAAKAEALVRRASVDLAALIHPDFIYVNAGGKTLDKPSYIDAYCVSGRVVFLDQQIAELQVKQFDGFAVATLIVNDKFSAGGRVVDARYRSLCVFSEAGGLWLWAAGQTMAQG